MKTLKPNLTQTALIALMAFTANASAEEEVALIQTSKPHINPQLMTIQTAQVLESYGIGFSGSGNIYKAFTNFSDNPIRGSIALGLGDVAELGFAMQELHTQKEESNKVMRGHMKMQLLEESSVLPSFSIAYGANLQDDFTTQPDSGLGVDYVLARSQFALLSSKNLTLGNYQISVHPGVLFHQSKLTEFGSARNLKVSKSEIEYQLGLTWQKDKNLVYMAEARSLKILNEDLLSQEKITYEDAYETNVGVRFYFRNWLFMDAGLRNMFVGKNMDETRSQIHANITGVIPLKSVFERISN